MIRIVTPIQEVVFKMCVCLCGVRAERQHRARARPRGPGRAEGLGARIRMWVIVCGELVGGVCPERTQNDRDSMYVCERVFYVLLPVSVYHCKYHSYHEKNCCRYILSPTASIAGCRPGYIRGDMRAPRAVCVSVRHVREQVRARRGTTLELVGRAYKIT